MLIGANPLVNSPKLASVHQIWKTFAISNKMTSTVQDIERRKGGQPAQLSCFGRTQENGGKFRTFRKEELAKVLPKNIERTPKIQLDGI